ncbi:MAG: flippase-like domain-containing protein [Candidatus Omnitrophica bacterium]|nr:flippase-like domain-containing protein [Candidatus Omnitrophota bacterium]
MTQKIKSVLSAAFFVLSIVLIIVYFKRHQDELFLISHWHSYHLLALLGIIFIFDVLSAFKSYLIIRDHSRLIRFSAWFKIFYTGKFVGFFISQGGTIYRSSILKSKFGFPVSSFIGFMIFFTWLDAVMIILTMLPLIFFCFKPMMTDHVIVYLMAVVGIFLFIPIIFFRIRQSENKKSSPIINYSFRIRDSLKAQFQDQPRFWKIVAINFCLLVLSIVQIAICFTAFSIQVSWMGIGIFTLVFLLSRTLNIVPGNVGLAEILCGTITKLLSLSWGIGVLISAIFRILNLGLSAIVIGIIKMVDRVSGFYRKSREQRL